MRTASSLIVLLLGAPCALAQDSVSKLPTLPGDAIDPHDPAEQLNDYVVDQAAFRSSWGTVFGVAPLVKGSQQRDVAPLFFTGLINAQALSRRVRPGAFPRSSYDLWTAAGFGVNNDITRNDPGTPVPTAGLPTPFRFGFAFGEFADGDPSPTALSHVTGGIAAFTPSLPSRLYVARVTAATNGTNDGCSLAAFGLGAVDEAGNVHFRADGFGTTNAGCPAETAFAGTNLFRVDTAARTALLNVLSNGFPGLADATATTQLLPNAATHNVPNAIPASVAGRPLLIGSNFARQYVFEQVAGSVVAGAAAAHLAGQADHRGAVGYSTRNFNQLFPGSGNGTAGILAGPTGTGQLRDRIALWGLAADGNFLSPIARQLPAPAAGLDPDQPTFAPAAAQEFYHYYDQTAFQGGASQVALGGDQAGNLLAAAVAHYGYTQLPGTNPSYTNPLNYIAVARTDPLTGTTTWTAAAWTDGVGGKSIYQNGTMVIGNLRGFGGAPQTGPAMSAPMIDSVGNVWFVGAYELASAPGSTSVGLFRSVWNATAGRFRLELVLSQGDVFAGRNSGVDYQIGFMTLNDSNSVSSGGAWSGNIAEDAFRNESTAGLATSDARTLGGIVVSASIVYDENNDGQFVRATGSSGVPGSPDEDYNVLLYVSASADCNGNDVPDDRDIFDGLETDANGNGVPDSCEGLTGTLYCFGDGSGTACPCGNASPVGNQEGCLSSFGFGGRVRASGSASLSNDTLVLLGTQMPNSSALYFQGTTQQSGGAGALFGDGLRCAGGTVIRLKTVANSGNASQYPQAGDPSISVRGLVTVPGTRTYQVWYRNAAAFCTSATFNVTNGVLISWQS